MSVSERWICASLYGHAFGTLHVCSNNGDLPISGVQQKGFDCTLIGWVWLTCPLSGVFTIVSVQLGLDYCPLYGVAGCPLFECIEVCGETIGTFRAGFHCSLLFYRLHDAINFVCLMRYFYTFFF